MIRVVLRISECDVWGASHMAVPMWGVSQAMAWQSWRNDRCRGSVIWCFSRSKFSESKQGGYLGLVVLGSLTSNLLIPLHLDLDLIVYTLYYTTILHLYHFTNSKTVAVDNWDEQTTESECFEYSEFWLSESILYLTIIHLHLHTTCLQPTIALWPWPFQLTTCNLCNLIRFQVPGKRYVWELEQRYWHAIQRFEFKMPNLDSWIKFKSRSSTEAGRLCALDNFQVWWQGHRARGIGSGTDFTECSVQSQFPREKADE